MFISQTTFSEDSIYKRQNCNLKLKSSFTKVKRIIPEKNHSTSTRNPVQTQETVYELSRSRRNEASFKAKAKRTTTKNKTNRKKRRKSSSWLRGYRKIVQTMKGYILFLVIERRKRICNSQSKDQFSFHLLSNHCVFDSFCYWYLKKFLKRYLVSDFIASNCKSRVSIDPC